MPFIKFSSLKFSQISTKTFIGSSPQSSNCFDGGIK